MTVVVCNSLLVTQMTSLPVECGPGGTGYTSLINSSVLSAVTHIWHPYVLHYDSVSPPVLLLWIFLCIDSLFLLCKHIHELQDLNLASLHNVYEASHRTWRTKDKFFWCNSLAKYRAHAHIRTNMLYQSTLPQKSLLLYLLTHGFAHWTEGMRRWRLASGEGRLSLTLFCSSRRGTDRKG